MDVKDKQIDLLKQKVKALEHFIETKARALYEAKKSANNFLGQIVAIFECSPDMILVTDMTGKISHSNSAAKLFLGTLSDRSIHEIIGDNVLPFDSPANDARELSVRTKVGDVPVFVTSSPLIQNDLKTGRVYSLHDLREMKRAQTALAEAQSASAAKSRFLANMSHEIRTPLNSVIGLAEVLDGMITDAEQQVFIRQIKSSGVALFSIVNDILDLSKVEAGQLTLDVATFGIKDLLEEVQDIFLHQADSKGTVIKFEVSEEVDRTYIGDPGRVRQILVNYVGNAVKFTSRGLVKILVHRSFFYRDGFRVTVIDTGIGIEPEALQQLFQPFHQADDSTTRHFGGSGLGLSICKNLAELMGGCVGAESRYGVGSQFWVDLPLGIAKEHLASNTPNPENVSTTSPEIQGSGRLLRVLVAEDNPANQLVVKAMMKRLGHVVDIVTNGQSAVEAVKRNGPYDLVFMDFQMPVMDGLEATRAIRLLKLDYHLPIIAMTASALRHEVEAARLAGMDDFMSKPVSVSELTRMVLCWGEHRYLADEPIPGEIIL